ncbi:UNVERIFIED_CONTAM: hypothetical protein Sradi_6415900 [Sesamum radiatum]|uniref:Uncharacterized protein n=1 Tax=Sesamum radiatum TaxID=300843 RepID=A0AAW2K5Q2_SESRA
MEVDPVEDTLLIQFGQEEQQEHRTLDNDALVIRALLANYEVGRVFIDSGSSTDILFGEAYDQMQLGDVPLDKVDTFIYGFAGEIVHPRGMISLPLTLGTTPLWRTYLLKFLVVDIPLAYNVILGRPMLNAFRAVISTYHMKVKFPVDEGVGEVRADILQACKCYIEAIKKGKNRVLDKTVEGNGHNKQGKDQIPGLEIKKDSPDNVQPVEELHTIKLIPGNIEKVTKIGSKMKDTTREETINRLHKN